MTPEEIESCIQEQEAKALTQRGYDSKQTFIG
jgi:hypothetical protein